MFYFFDVGDAQLLRHLTIIPGVSLCVCLCLATNKESLSCKEVQTKQTQAVRLFFCLPFLVPTAQFGRTSFIFLFYEGQARNNRVSREKNQISPERANKTKMKKKKTTKKVT